MFTKPDSRPPARASIAVQKTRKQTLEEINHAMARFPLIVEILGELREVQVPCPGDEDIRHGCERALTAMLVELARIEPAEPDKPTKAEETALHWLHSKKAVHRIDVDRLQRFEQFIERILGGPRQHS